MRQPLFEEWLPAYAKLDPALAAIYSRFGKVVLVPLDESGNATENPPSFQHTQTAAYLRNLTTSNIALRCGDLSNGLFAFSFKVVSEAERFLNDNTIAARTAIIDGYGQSSFFFRIKGFRPAPKDFSVGRWYGNKDIIPVFVRDKLQPQLVWMTKHEPIEVSFGDLQWSDEIQAFFTPDLIEAQYGKPFYSENSTKQDLNCHYWGCYFSCEHKVKFSAEEDQFYSYDCTTRSWSPILAKELEGRLLHFLLQHGRKAGHELLRRPCSPRQIEQILKAMSLVCIGAFPGSSAALESFVCECLERDPCGDISVEELYASFCSFCEQKSLPRMPQCRFQKKSPILVQQLFAIGKSNSLVRGGRFVRGYHNLKFKLSVHEDACRMAGSSNDISSSARTAGTAGTT